MPGSTMPMTGSGDLTSMTTAVLAVYCLGSSRLTTSVVATVAPQCVEHHPHARQQDEQELLEVSWRTLPIRLGQNRLSRT